MSRLNTVSLRLLGPFAIEASVGRTITLSVRAKIARGLLAYLAMQPDFRVRREELATLCDTVDVLARHSLRQCLIRYAKICPLHLKFLLSIARQSG